MLQVLESVCQLWCCVVCPTEKSGVKEEIIGAQQAAPEYAAPPSVDIPDEHAMYEGRYQAPVTNGVQDPSIETD